MPQYITVQRELVNLEELYPNTKFPNTDRVTAPDGKTYYKVHGTRIIPSENQQYTHPEGPDGYEIVNGKAHQKLVITDNNASQIAERLAEYKARAVRRVNDMAEAERLKYVAQGSGQSMVYLRKEEEARRLLSDWYIGLDYKISTNLADIDFDVLVAKTPSPNPANYPHMNAEVGQTGATIVDVAKAVLAKADQWKLISSYIEGKRQTYQNAINAAADIAAINTVIQGISYAQ